MKQLNTLVRPSIAVFFTLLVISAQIQSANGADDSASFSRPRAEITRTELTPDIDGVLDDEIWENATVISDLHQFQPVDHGAPTERSEFYITYNERYLYIAARLYDSDPAGISARQLIQGQGMQFDDAFEFILDTFNNGRTGYHFQVNPNGIRREGVFENPNNLNRDWTGIWLVESRIDDEGWTAEVAIPFNTLNFDPDSEEWGFTIARTIARKREELAWSSFNRNLNPTTTGIISGIRDIRQGMGLDIIPSATFTQSEDYTSDESESNFEPSVNIFYKVTPSLTAALTINTDFSATEVDNRQVNLSRFSLFFPEKRDFFLQDVDIFSFGGLNGGGNFGGANGIPFYSRRIGLNSSTGLPVDIEAGVKLTGRVGAWNVGGLAVQQGDSDNLDGQSVFVGRALVNVLSESSVGAIFTSGDPNNENDNSLVGVDFRYQNTRFSESHSLRGNAWFQKTDTDGRNGDDKAYGVDANFDTQNNGFGGFTKYQYFGEDYNPALGFASRRGVESLDFGSNGRYFFEDNALIRNVFTFMRVGHTRKLDSKELQSENWFWRMMNFNTHRGDQLGFGLARNREGLETDFQIRPGIIIPAGKYSFVNYHVELRFSNQRTIAPYININKGEFYNGDRIQVNSGVEWRPDEHFYFSFNYNYQNVELPAGDFISRLIRINANYAFTSKWSWINTVQYDNGSDGVGINSRLRWNPQAGEDMFLVMNYNFDADGAFSRLSQKNSVIALKYTKTFRF